MRRLLIASLFTVGLCAAVEAAPAAETVSMADFKALVERLNKLEAENKAQAARIAELENQDKQVKKWMDKQNLQVAEQEKKFELQTETLGRLASARAAQPGVGTTTNDTGNIYTTSQGFKYYLADASARIFEPLSESGLKITPYGYLVFEGVYSDHELSSDWTADWVNPNSQSRNQTTLSMQDSIMGLQFQTPEANHGWMFSGRAEFDLAGAHQNDYAFHWRHLYINAEHESGWSILFGQTWHLWKIVSPSEIDSAWMENSGHPYRRSPQLRVTKRWDIDDESSFEARIGMVKGGPGMGGDRDSDLIEDNSASPWVLFEGAAVYDHVAPWQEDKKRWLVGVGGMYGRDKSHRMIGPGVYGGSEDEYDSMMGMLAGSLPMGPFTLTGQIYGGENLGGIQAGCGQTVAYHTFNAPGNSVRAIGGFADLGYQINDDWSCAVGWGFDNPVDSDIEGALDGNNSILYNDRAYVVVFYQVIDNFKLGLEYARLMTSYWEGDGDHDYSANRIQFSAFYDF